VTIYAIIQRDRLHLSAIAPLEKERVVKSTTPSARTYVIRTLRSLSGSGISVLLVLHTVHKRSSKLPIVSCV
jgi:hypothetical protein